MQDPSSGDFYVTIESTFPSESQSIQHLQEIRKRIEPCHQYYLGPVKYFMITNNNFCSKQFKVIQIYPFEEYSFKEEIEIRQEQNRYFS